MNSLCHFYRTTLGKKVIMAATGLVLVLFVIGHMLGNLKMFAGIDPASGLYKLDEYARLLREILAHFMGRTTFLWLVRIGLLGAAVLHVITAIQLTLINRRARPVDYAKVEYRSATIASRTMVFGGLFLAAFIIFHILHLTIGNVHSSFVEGQVYANVYNGFQVGWVTLFYLIAMSFLALHLYHGAWSALQTLGIDSPRLNCLLRSGAKVVAAVLFLGFVSVPLASYFHLIAPPDPSAVKAMSVDQGGLASSEEAGR